MAETITPEQRADKALPCNCHPMSFGGGKIHSLSCPSRRRDAVVSAIRAAETAAVEAERARCAKIADEWHEWYEKPGSGTRHAQRIAHHIRNPEADNAR